VIPTNAEPVTKWSNSDEAFHDIVKHVNRVVTEIKTRRALLEADEYTRVMRYQEALACYEQVLLLDQANGAALFGRARTLFLLRQVDASIEAFTLAEQITPAAGDNLFSHLFKARAFNQRERYAESLAADER
jgi:tetratricopeptide (TPR) repeat protein